MNMESPANKRFRGEDNTMPLLVSHIFLTNLRDVNLLKACRLVCKSWNIDACLSLRVYSKVQLHEDDTGYKTISKLLLKAKTRLLKNLPSSFQNFEVVGHKFSRPAFIKLVLQPTIKITSLNFVLYSYDWDRIQSKLGLILAANHNNITDVSIAAQGNFKSYKKISLNWERLKVLKNFRFQDSCVQCIHIPFLNIFLRDCKLERMDCLNIYDGKILTCLLTPDKVENLKHLEIGMWEISGETLEHLSKLRFLQLKHLTFEVGFINIETSHLHQLLRLFWQNASPVLKQLSTNTPITNITFDTRFPSLQDIQVGNNTDLSALNPGSLPALSKVCLQLKVTEPSLPIVENDIVPHHGVQFLEILIKDSHPNGLSHQHLLMLFTDLSRQFPKVSTFVLNKNILRRSDVIAICETFPKLTTLSLDGFSNINNNDVSFCGRNCSLEFQPSCSFEDIPSRKCVLDFKELECINFCTTFFVHRYIIVHCLPRLPKLRQITLYWHKDLSVKLLQESLGHLEKIVISNSADIPEDEMKEISNFLPNVYFM